MRDLFYILMSVLALVAAFYLVYLRGKNLQQICGLGVEAVSGKKRRLEEIHAIAGTRLTSIKMHKGDGSFVTLSDEHLLHEFCAFFEAPKVVKLKQRELSRKLWVDLQSDDKEHHFHFQVHSSMYEDIVLNLLEGFEQLGVRLPGLNRWLVKNIDGYRDLLEESTSQ